jgi:hypothetical protein
MHRVWSASRRTFGAEDEHKASSERPANQIKQNEAIMVGRGYKMEAQSAHFSATAVVNVKSQILAGEG